MACLLFDETKFLDLRLRSGQAALASSAKLLYKQRLTKMGRHRGNCLWGSRFPSHDEEENMVAPKLLPLSLLVRAVSVSLRSGITINSRL